MSSSLRHPKGISLSICFFLVLTVLTNAQAVPNKRPLTHDVYDSWRSINSPEISVDGEWILYLDTPQKGDADLVVLNTKNRREYRHTIGFSGEGTEAEREARAAFSYDSKHVVFLISPSEAEVKESKQKKKKEGEEGASRGPKAGNSDDKLKKKLGILSLSDGKVQVVEEVKSFKLPEENGGWVAYLKEEKKKDPDKKDEPEEKEAVAQDEKKKEKEKDKKFGTQLVLRSLADGGETVVESVLDFLFTKDGRTFFYTVSDKENPDKDGVYALSPGGESFALLTGQGNYTKWALNKNETHLAFLTDREDFAADKPTFNLYGLKIGDSKASLWVTHTSTTGFPKGMAVSDKSALSFTEDGRIVMFGITAIPEPETDDEDKDEEESAKFELWHWNDPYPQPQQKLMAESVRNNAWESLYFVDSGKFVQLADKEIPDVELAWNGKVAFAQSSWPYTKRVSYFGSYNDVYVFDPASGKKTLVKKELYGRASLSPQAKYITWFEGTDWFAYHISSKTTVNLTESLDVRFEMEDWDTPSPPRAYGIMGWTENDDSILIYDRCDIWEIKPDGSSARMITEGFGRKQDLSFRYIRFDPEEKNIDPAQTLILRTTNQATMAHGFYTDRVQGNSQPNKLLMADNNFSQVSKAKNTDRFFFTRTAFDEYPDLWVSDLDFKEPQKLTDLGRQMDPFLWGKAELRDFYSADGKPLKGILVKPENFDPNNKYPMMVYIYETLHQGHHGYRHPSPGSSINFSYYVSNGYVMWMPDIEYDTGYPGSDALKCVLPGINMLVREGFIDPKAIGIQGHSWGGYQICYMITQTNIFAAANGGAPVSNMTSAYGGIRWGSGMVRQFQYEHTQSRLGASLWEVPLRYIENSPLFWADKIETPLMYMHNDEDGAVPWYQGIEFIMALRRLEKEAYMFNYNGEDHGLRKRVNQEDWTIRLAEFFDHHLKGAPMPDWMKHGIQAWDKKEEKK